jgi:hypothetical protein
MSFNGKFMNFGCVGLLLENHHHPPTMLVDVKGEGGEGLLQPNQPIYQH